MTISQKHSFLRNRKKVGKERAMQATDSAEQKQGPSGLLALTSRLQIHQYNDPEILEFFIEYRVEYDLVGDHLFIIHGRESDLAAGPGDWLVARPGGEVDVELGDYALRPRRATREARRERSKVVELAS